ncbi:MAG: heavy metal-binding domain-containing protein [Candidatus Solibacter sp.]
MDKDVRSATPGKCPRCGMTLVPGVAEPMEYLVELRLRPSAPRAGQKVELLFRVKDPKTGRPVTDFQIMHEKLYHMFIVSQDLRYFLHEHPVQSAGGVFRFSTSFPRPGMYRILSDVYPSGGTPQLIPRTVIIPGGAITPGGVLTPDFAPKEAVNLRVTLKTEPPQPVAGQKTLMFFHVEPPDGIEKFIGAWGHMLAASSDLVDMIHTHPFIADGGPDIQFNMVFPRPSIYRVWVQFQRKGVVNTVAFNVPASELK